MATLDFTENFFALLSQRPRLRIMALLLHFPQLCVSDIYHTLGYNQALVSRHMQYVRSLGVVDTQRQDNFIFYSIKPEYRQLFRSSLAPVWDDALLAADRQRLKDKGPIALKD